MRDIRKMLTLVAIIPVVWALSPSPRKAHDSIQPKHRNAMPDDSVHGAHNMVAAESRASINLGSESNQMESLALGYDLFDAMSHEQARVFNSTPATPSFTGYSSGLVLMLAFVIYLYRHLGVSIVAQIVAYVICLTFIKITIKWVFDQGFAYPTFITSCHLLVSSVVAACVLLYRKETNGTAFPVPTMAELFFGILPIASTFGISIALDNIALQFVSVAFAEVVASTNSVMAAFLLWVFGMPVPMRAIPPIGVVVIGCLISVTGELSFSAFGLALMFLSIFIRGFKSVLQQKLMTGETKDKFDPVALTAWSCFCGFGFVFGYSLATEKMAPWKTILDHSAPSSLIVALLGSCLMACALNMSALFVIKHLGAVGVHVVAQAKAIMVVAGGIVLLSETFTRLQWLGFSLILLGVYQYSHVSKDPVKPDATTKGAEEKP